MAKIWFTAHPDTQHTFADVFAAARIARAAEVADVNGWNFFGPERDAGSRDYYIDVPDKSVTGVLDDLREAGIAPETVDFTDGTTEEEAAKLAVITVVWEIT